MSGPQVTSRRVTRLNIPLQGSFEDAVRRYESLVPPLDATKLQSLSESQAPWNDFLDRPSRIPLTDS